MSDRSGRSSRSRGGRCRSRCSGGVGKSSKVGNTILVVVVVGVVGVIGVVVVVVVVVVVAVVVIVVVVGVIVVVVVVLVVVVGGGVGCCKAWSSYGSSGGEVCCTAWGQEEAKHMVCPQSLAHLKLTSSSPLRIF